MLNKGLVTGHVNSQTNRQQLASQAATRTTGVAIWPQIGRPGMPLVDPGSPYGATLKTWPADLTTAKQTTRLLSTMLGLWSRQV